MAGIPAAPPGLSALPFPAGAGGVWLLLEAPYTNLADLARHHAPLLPGATLFRGAYDSAARIGRVRCSVLVMLGERDRVIPPALSRRIHAAAPEPEALWVAPTARHEDLVEAGAVQAAAAFVATRVG